MYKQLVIMKDNSNHLFKNKIKKNMPAMLVVEQ
jgi:hypothetical protein